MKTSRFNVWRDVNMKKIINYQLLIIISILCFFQACGKEKIDSAQVTPTFSNSQTKTRILVAYYTRTGTTKKLAQAIIDGVNSVENTYVIMKMVTEVQTEDLLSADGVIVGSPVYYGNMASQVKQFFDNWNFKYGIYPERTMGYKVGAAFATGYWATGGKEMVINSINAAFLNAAMIIVGGLKGPGASATGEGKEAGRGKDLLRYEYEDGYDLGRRMAEVAAALKHGLRKKETITDSGTN